MRLDEFNSVQIHESRYRQLLELEKQVDRIRAEREQEIRMHELLSRDGYFEAIFETKDGLTCFEKKHDYASKDTEVVYRACESSISVIDLKTADKFRPIEQRKYRRVDRYIRGIPVYREE